MSQWDCTVCFVTILCSCSISLKHLIQLVLKFCSCKIHFCSAIISSNYFITSYFQQFLLICCHGEICKKTLRTPLMFLIWSLIKMCFRKPFPTQGNVLNIKLSENEEGISQADGSQKKVIVDTYFQMNYGSGEWKRFKKYRDVVSW